LSEYHFLYIIVGKTKEALDILSKAYEKGGNPKTICDDLLRINYHLIYTLANNENKNAYDIYDKEKIDIILQKSSIPLLNQTWQMLIKGKEEIEKLPQQIEALEIVVIRMSFASQLPQVEEIIAEIKKNKNDELKENIDNIDLGNDVKKILEIFPESKILKDNNK